MNPTVPFIAHARDNVPALIAEVRRLRTLTSEFHLGDPIVVCRRCGGALDDGDEAVVKFGDIPVKLLMHKMHKKCAD